MNQLIKKITACDAVEGLAVMKLSCIGLERFVLLSTKNKNFVTFSIVGPAAFIKLKGIGKNAWN